jgi:hypothetical protein
MWLDYETALIVATAFGIVWGARHFDREIRNRSALVLLCTVLVLAVYLSVRLRLVHQYLAPGAEEELLVTYRSKLLLFEDVIANFFVLLFMVLSNYLPAFLTGSSALTFLDKADIIAEQHGYHVQQQHMVVLNHLFLWRFYAGVLVTLFVGFAGWVAVAAWRKPAVRWGVLTALCLMVLAGFSTHLAVKMRPYTTLPGMPYKVVLSVSAFTVLVAYVLWVCYSEVRSVAAKRAMVVGAWSLVFVAALTRPAMQNKFLAEIGIVGLGDPLGKILQWLR